MSNPAVKPVSNPAAKKAARASAATRSKSPGKPVVKTATKTATKAATKAPTKARPKRGNKKVNRAWLHDHMNDPYVKLAQREGYRARAAYKLKEIDEALGLIKPGQVVVDLGSVPGAWSQYLRRRFAPEGAAVGALNGTVIALDLLDMEPIEGVSFLKGDFREEAVVAQLDAALGGRKVDLILSDMAPNLSGIEVSDSARIAHLVELAIEFARRQMQPGGALVCKAFHGSGYSQLVKLFKANFRTVKPIKPKASRDKSAETFIVGIGLREVTEAE